MILNESEREKLRSRVSAVEDYLGINAIAKKAGQTDRVYYKVVEGQNVKVQSIIAFTKALTEVEKERQKAIKEVEKILS